MQIEKHIKIVPTPTGAVVFFAGQVCLSVNEHSGRYNWSISPVFARLTTGISTCFQVPMVSWEGQETLAEAIADGLTRLDEMQAFYGVIDMPEDTYVEEHLSEEVDEGTDYSGVEADVKRTGKTHEQLAAEHRAYAKQMRGIGKDSLAVRSEMLADDHDKASKKTNESVEDLLAESFVVRKVGQSRNHPSRIMISAAAVINRAREMAKEAGEKSHGKFIKLAHSEIASNMKAESVQYEDALSAAFQSIKEDCRAEALSMADSLLEAQQLASELFEDIVQEYLDEALVGRMSDMSKYTHPDIENSKPFSYAEWKASGVKPRKPRGHKEAEAIGDAQRKIDQVRKTNEEVEELDEAALSGDAYWKAKEAESKEEFLKAQRKALGLPEPVKRGRGKPTLIDRDLLKTRAHSNVEAGKRPTAGFDRNEKIHFVRHLKNHPDFADKHVSQAGRPTGTTKVAKEQKDLAKKKQDTAFSMWAGLGKR